MKQSVVQTVLLLPELSSSIEDMTYYLFYYIVLLIFL